MMKLRNLPKTDLEVSTIAFGCANLVPWSRDPLSKGEIAGAAAMIEAALDAGITLFDHADLYAFGRSEAAFGELLKQFKGLRERIVIQSKCGQVFPPGWKSGDPIGIDTRSTHIVETVEGSLGRLGIEHLDILLLHVADCLAQPEEIARAFDRLWTEGKVRHFGVSNHGPRQIELLKKHVDRPICVNQIRLGLAQPQALLDGAEFAIQISTARPEIHISDQGAGIVDYCRLHDIQVQAWSPLRGCPIETSQQAPEDGLGHVLNQIAERVSATPAQVAIAWLLKHPAGIVPVIGSTRPERIKAMAEAEQVGLTSEDYYALIGAAVSR